MTEISVLVLAPDSAWSINFEICVKHVVFVEYYNVGWYRDVAYTYIVIWIQEDHKWPAVVSV